MKNNIKKPMSTEKINKILTIMSVLVGGIFALKNIIAKSFSDAILISVCLFIFVLSIVILNKLKVKKENLQFIICIFIVFLVFIISVNSGKFYSDDFPLYLAVIGLSGLYMRPTITILQMFLIDILLIASYFIHPEKADPPAQYAMCVIVFSIAAYTFYMTIRRGCSYIGLAREKTNESKELIHSLKNAGETLQQNCNESNKRIHSLKSTNDQLEKKTQKLRIGSNKITNDTQDVVHSFEDVKTRMEQTEDHINNLNHEVKTVEDTLNENKEHLSQMTNNIELVHNTFTETNSVFEQLQTQIDKIAKVTQQLGSISYNTTILALNATIEATRAGEAGKGFEVVAANIQDLAKDSTDCSDQVIHIVTEMQKLIQKTSAQLVQSTSAVKLSLNSLDEFHGCFDDLTTQFGSLYTNIEQQNTDVHSMDDMVVQLKQRIEHMTAASCENQNAVNDISSAMNIYKENIDDIINDTTQIHEISTSMLELASE